MFSVLGLSYGITFLVDLIVVLKVTFNPTLIKKELAAGNGFWKPLWVRFKNILTKDNRPYRMTNDLVWFVVNVITFCLAGPLYLLLNPILNLIGFSYDTVHESFWLGRDWQKHSRLITKIDNEIAELVNQKSKAQPLTPKDTSIIQEKISPTGDTPTTQEKIDALNLMKTQLVAKRNEIARRRLWISICTTLILIGMVLVYFPPTTIPGAFLIGSGLALAAGSLLTGLGRRIFLTVEYFVKKFNVFEAVKHFLSHFSKKPQNDIKLTSTDAHVTVKLNESGHVRSESIEFPKSSSTDPLSPSAKQPPTPPSSPETAPIRVPRNSPIMFNQSDRSGLKSSCTSECNIRGSTIRVGISEPFE